MIPALRVERTEGAKAVPGDMLSPSQVSSLMDSLCAAHHRTGKDSYHRLGPRKFGEIHNLDLAAIVQRLNLKPMVRIQNGEFVAYLEGGQYRLGTSNIGVASALRNLRRVCGENRLALEAAS